MELSVKDKSLADGFVLDIQNLCNPLLIGFGGSVAYGTNLPTSDIDIRGVYINPMEEFIGINNSEQLQIPGVDATIYSIKKIFNLLLNCNPNVIELLGLKPEHYLFMTGEGKMLLKNADIFLSKRAAKSFGGYACAQLNRLMNRSGRALERLGANETRSLQKAILSIKDREGVQNIRAEEKDGIPYVSFNETLPADQYFRIQQELANVHSDYRSSDRNQKAANHDKLPKHMMHLLRLYMMAIDILEKKEIVTYREAEHDLLMSVRNGDYLEDDGLTPTRAFEDILQDYRARFDAARASTTLPDSPDYKEANRLMMSIVREYYDF